MLWTRSCVKGRGLFTVLRQLCWDEAGFSGDDQVCRGEVGIQR